MAEPASAPPAGVRLAPWVAPWLVAAAAALAFAGAFAGGFQFDDFNVIVHDPRVQSLGAWWRSMPGIRPLLKLTFAANHASGLGLAGFHAFNVAVHAANAALAVLLLRALEARTASDGTPPGHAPTIAALLFAVHPVQTEAVTYVSGRSASLAAAFVLASLAVHVVGREGHRRRAASFLSPALFALALATREQAAVLPLVLLAAEASDPRRAFSWRGALRATAGHWLVLGAAAAAALASPVYRRMLGESLALRGPAENLLTHLGAVAWLAGQAVRPDRLEADPLLPVRTALDLPAALAAAGVLGALVAGIALLRRRPEAALALLWTVLWLAPLGWLVPRAEPANDRHLYLALLGPAWLLGRALAPGAARGAWRAVLAGLAALLVALLAAGTVARNRVYADEVAFWSAAVSASPANPRALNNLGFALAGECRLAEADAAFVKAIELEPGGFRAAVNLSLLRAGEPLAPGEPRCAASCERGR
jgi:hypothetical protein